jgi:hypothetical protein
MQAVFKERKLYSWESEISQRKSYYYWFNLWTVLLTKIQKEIKKITSQSLFQLHTSANF